MAVPDEYVPSAGAAFRLRIGARPLDIDSWTSAPDDDWVPMLRMKQELLSERFDNVVASLPGSESACEEAARAVLLSHDIEMPPESGIDALVTAARVVADDLCIMIADTDGRMILGAAVVCAPNRWVLAEKLGLPMGQIHAPVARYDIDLESPTDALLARLTPERPIWRINWGVADDPALFQPRKPSVSLNATLESLWLRIEYQTLRRLPETGAVLFTIRTYQETLADLGARAPRLLSQLAEAVGELPPDVLAYKSITPYAELIRSCSRR